MTDAVDILRRRCFVCRHPQAAVIDLALGTRSEIATLAKQFGLSESSLERHKRRHLRPALMRAAEGRESNTSSSILDRLEALNDRAIALLDRAEKEKAPVRDVAIAIREARATLETIGKLLGEFRDDAPRNDNRQLHVHLEKLSLEELKAIAASVSRSG